MKKLIIRGNPGVRCDGIIEYDSEERALFSVDRQGDWHGPDHIQLRCIADTEDEYETFEKREFVPHWFETKGVDAEVVEVIRKRGTVQGSLAFSTSWTATDPGRWTGVSHAASVSISP